MSTMRFTGLVIACAAFAACSDSPSNRSITAPDTRPSADVATDGLIPVIGAEIVSEESMAADVSADAAATGGRASGHYALNLAGGVLLESTSFVALSTDPTPTGKGQVQWDATNGATTFKVHADVACLSIVGNQAWVSGPIDRFIVNGEPVTPAFANVQFRVIDLGEGGGTVEGGSQLYYAVTPLACASHLPVPMYVSNEGNIQVQQR